MSKVIGIDLGTTNSCVAVLEGGEPVVIPNSEGGRTTPSVVSFTQAGERVVGEAAKRQQAVNAARTVLSIKREMGTDYRVKIDGKAYTPQEISAMILQKLRRDAEDFLGEPVSQAVITVPAYFTDSQRQATRDAGRIAGLEVLRIINEPTAAAFAYGLDHGQAQKILVYDLGGGTCDVSLIEIGDGVIEVLATSGDNHLGGDDFDERLADYLADEFKRTEKIDLRRDKAAMLRVREAAEKAKRELSGQMSTQVTLPFLTQDANGPHHLDVTVTRAQFEGMTRDLVERTCGPVSQVMTDAALSMSDLGQVLLVGGSTRMPAVQEMVKKLTGKVPARNVNPDECVAMGAALQGGKLPAGNGMVVSSAAQNVILMDVTPLSLSIETVGGVATKIIDRNTTIPTRHSQIFSTAAPFHTAVDIKVLQGERYYARDNKLLGNFRLKGIRRAMEDARQYEAQDKARREASGIRNEAEKLIYETEQALGKDKQISHDDKKKVKEDIAALRKAVHKTKPESITTEQAAEIARLAEALKESAKKIQPES